MPEIQLLILGAGLAAALFYLLKPKGPRPREVPHDFFDRLWLWPPDGHTRWEAELDLGVPGVDEPVGVYAETTHDDWGEEEPADSEVAFCREWLADLDNLFRLVRPSIEEVWSDWVERDFSNDWREDLRLVGLSVPLHGDRARPWEVSYFCEPAAHYFTVELRGGRPVSVSVDG